MTNFKTSIKSIVFIWILLYASFSIGQNIALETSNTITLNGITFNKDSEGFSNLFEAKYTAIKRRINLLGLDYSFKVVHNYKNVVVIKITNNIYFEAKNTQKRIKQANKNINIKFIR